MVRTITKQEAETSFANVLGALDKNNGTLTVEDNGQPIAFVLTPEEFQRLNRERFWAIVDEIRARNPDADPDETLAFATEIVEEVRKERYAAQQAAAESGR
jgi:hypothetical protein